MEELNQYTLTEIKVTNAELNVTENFPYISLTFDDVRISEPKDFGDGQLAIAQNLHLSFNPIDLLLQKFEIEQVSLERAVVNITINKDGIGNYNIIKTDSSRKGGPLSFALNKIKLNDVLLNLRYDPGMQNYSILHKNVMANLAGQDDQLEIGMDGDLHIYDIIIAGQSYFRNKRIALSSRGNYYFADQKLEILPSVLKVAQSRFNIAGDVSFSQKNDIDLTIEGEKGKINTLISLLPTHITKQLSNYQSAGNVYFQGKVKGEFSGGKYPAIDIDFGFENATIKNTELKGEIQHAYLTGNFTNGAQRKAKTSALRIKKFSASFQDRPVRGFFAMTDLSDPSYEVSFNGSFDLASFIKFYSVSQIESASGILYADFYFLGRPDDLKNSHEKIEASGEIKLENTSLSIRNSGYAFSGLNGNFLFNRNDVALNDLKGMLGKNDFLLNGYFRNFIPNILFDEEKLIVNASLDSERFNLNEFLEASRVEPSESQKNAGSNNSSKEMAINLNCRVSNFIYNNLQVEDLKTDLAIDEPIWRLTNTSGKMCGGRVTSNTVITFDGNTQIKTNVQADGIDITSLFSSFNNFDQTFITDKNLKGIMSGTADLSIPLDENDNVLYDKLLGNVKMTVDNGALVGFTPMQKLSLFVKEKELYNISFSQLKNNFVIGDNVIFIPEMEIKSNVSDIKVYGTHSFDNEMNYKLTVPLTNFHKNDKDEIFGAIEEDLFGNTLLFLTIRGTADNYKIAYDTKRTGKKIKEDLKKEKEEIIDIIKNRRDKDDDKSSPGLSDENFFDFE